MTEIHSVTLNSSENGRKYDKLSKTLLICSHARCVRMKCLAMKYLSPQNGMNHVKKGIRIFVDVLNILWLE
jgi:hypothetical protein